MHLDINFRNKIHNPITSGQLPYQIVLPLGDFLNRFSKTKL